MTPLPRRLVASLLALAALSGAHAEQRAVTEKGDEVVLEDDNTWHYVKAPPPDASAPPVNPATFSRPRDASFPVRSTRNGAVLWLDPKKCSFEKRPPTNADAEYGFKCSGRDVMGLMINERIGVPMDRLQEAVLHNIRKNASEAEVVRREIRHVNGRDVLFLQVNATVNGMKVTYFAYLHGDDQGTTQVFAFTAQAIASARASFVEEFLDGLTFEAAGPTGSGDAKP